MLSFRRLPGRVSQSLRLFSTAPPNTVKVTVDGKEVTVPNGATVLNACEAAGVYVPRFCYHERLAIAGNCRMCLVEVVKSPKPVASCAFPVMPGMIIKTDTDVVKKAREGVMEFMLANHPLDCPICDQGGECDLQDQSMEYGSDRSRFREIKRAVEDKNLGPFVKTVMTRCIHCTRCVRFATGVAGVETLGVTGRGQTMEIGTYVPKFFDSEISGNVIDLCPVGALTSKPYAFQARPWDLEHTETIDITDAVGSNIRVDNRGPEIMRILPRLNEEVNEEWISDKTRFHYDGLKRQRLDTPMIRKGSEFVPATWREAFDEFKKAFSQVQPSEVIAIAGDHADVETMVLVKDLFSKFGVDNFQHEQHADFPLSNENRSDYVFNSTLAGVEDSDLVLFVGTNPRMEAAVWNARVRRLVRSRYLEVASIGPEMDLAYRHTHLGTSPSILSEIASGKHPFAAKLAAAKKPMIVVGMSVLKRKDAKAIIDTIKSLKDKAPNLFTSEWNGFNVLHTSASRVGSLDVGFVPAPTASKQPAKFAYLINSDNFDSKLIAADAFVVYQGSHGDVGAARANLILPGSAYTEKSATYVNMEGRPQQTLPCIAAPSDAREDWKIIRALSESMGKTLPYNTLQDVRSRIAQVAPQLATYESLTSSPAVFSSSSSKQSIDPAPLEPLFDNFYFTDAICRSSKILARGSAQLPVSRNSYKQALSQSSASS